MAFMGVHPGFGYKPVLGQAKERAVGNATCIAARTSLIARPSLGSPICSGSIVEQSAAEVLAEALVSGMTGRLMRASAGRVPESEPSEGTPVRVLPFGQRFLSGLSMATASTGREH